MTDINHYASLLAEIKLRIQTAQARAVLAVNAEMIRLYWQVGQMLHLRQDQEGWGAAVIPRLAADIRNALPEVQGFSERNLKRMLAFYRAYADEPVFVPQPVAQMPSECARALSLLEVGSTQSTCCGASFSAAGAASMSGTALTAGA